MTQTARYAIYAAPRPGSPLAHFGAALLGRDAASGRQVAPLVPDGVEAAAWHDLTAEPRRYGFHGTLKAPFRLAEGRTYAELEGFAARFAERHGGTAVALRVQRIGRFFALVPEGRPAALHALADAAVRDFDPFRAPLSPADREKRGRATLSPRQAELLERWGYPYVLDAFGFHMTLTGPVPADRADAVEAGLRTQVTSALGGEPVIFDLADICLFEQPAPDAPFTIRARFPLLAAREHV